MSVGMSNLEDQINFVWFESDKMLLPDSNEHSSVQIVLYQPFLDVEE